MMGRSMRLISEASGWRRCVVLCVGLVLLSIQPAWAADDSCIFANDGECDIGGACDEGTDATDCGLAAADSGVREDSPLGLIRLASSSTSVVSHASEMTVHTI